MKKKIFNVVRACVSFLIVAVLLTSCGADHYMKKGEKALAIGEYYDASNFFKRGYSSTPPKERELRGKRAARLAYAYDKMGSTQKAIAAYRNQIRYKQDSLPTHLSFARLLLKNGNYKEAAEEFQMILNSMPNNQLATDGLKSAQTAPKIKQLGSRYTVKKMDIFNSRRSDYAPMLCGDEHDQLFFSSTRNEAQGDELSGITGAKAGDIFYSQKDDKGKWGKPQTIESGLNTEYDEGACCFSPDQRVMYFTQCASDPSYPRFATIMTSNRSDAAWGKGTKLELSRDTLSSYAHPAVSPDGEWLYFVSDMPGGLGGLDIWRVRLTAAGLGGVENLGKPINTEGNEMFPSFRPNGDLYFSSDGHPGMGGLDIFIAKVGNDRRYHLEHPGYPLNSQGDDFGITFEGPHNRGFFSSNRGDGRGWDHIYSFENPEIIQTVKGWVYEMDGYELPAAQVYLVGNDGTNLKLSVKMDGSFEQVVEPGVSYVMLATCPGFLNHKEEITIEPTEKSEEHVLQFPLASIRVPVLIDNIFYDFDKATLRPESSAALDELVKMLQENSYQSLFIYHQPKSLFWHQEHSDRTGSLRSHHQHLCDISSLRWATDKCAIAVIFLIKLNTFVSLMHIVHNLALRHKDNQIFRNKAHSLFLHLLRNPNATIFCHTKLTADNAHVSSVQVTCTTNGVGVSCCYSHLRQVAGNLLGIGIELLHQLINVITWLHFNHLTAHILTHGNKLQ